MTLTSELKAQWMKIPTFKAEYDALEDEFSLARELNQGPDPRWTVASGISATYGHHTIGYCPPGKRQDPAVHANHCAYRRRYRHPRCIATGAAPMKRKRS